MNYKDFKSFHSGKGTVDVFVMEYNGGVSIQMFTTDRLSQSTSSIRFTEETFEDFKTFLNNLEL